MSHDIILQSSHVDFLTGGITVHALKNADIRFRSGQLTALVGESGSGKSVLGMSILGLLPPTASIAGTCQYGEHDLYHCSERALQEIRCKLIGLIPQNPIQSLNPVLRLSRQLIEPLTTHCGTDRKQALQQTRASLRQFGFQDPDTILKSFSFQLSGGMNQRVVACMGLACKPDWIIADEPTKGLDSILRRQVFQVLSSARDSGAGSMIIITHDLLLAQKLCDQVAVLYRGEIVEQGLCRDVFQHPLHPYTEGLIHSIPESGMIPIPHRIEGQNPEQSQCCFYARCSKAGAHCCDRPIKNCEVANGRIVRCSRYA